MANANHGLQLSDVTLQGPAIEVVVPQREGPRPGHCRNRAAADAVCRSGAATSGQTTLTHADVAVHRRRSIVLRAQQHVRPGEGRILRPAARSVCRSRSLIPRGAGMEAEGMRSVFSCAFLTGCFFSPCHGSFVAHLCELTWN